MTNQNSRGRRHLTGIAAMSRRDIGRILRSAGIHCDHPVAAPTPLQGRTAVNLFFEPSTRTQISFELAAHRIGMRPVNFSAGHSSMQKGESMRETFRTIAAMQPDAIVVRHPTAGMAQELAELGICPVINAGDGCHEHPTQALADALALQRHCPDFPNITVAICGDIAHSRVARSNALLLRKFGAVVRFVAPTPYMDGEFRQLAADLGVPVFDEMRTGIRDADAVMMLRNQKERWQGETPADNDYASAFRLDAGLLEAAKPGAVVLHPGPVDAGVEIAHGLLEDPRCLMLRQVAAGVAVRMAVFEWVLG